MVLGTCHNNAIEHPPFLTAVAKAPLLLFALLSEIFLDF